MLKIISGSHKSQIINQPNTNKTRPVSQKVRGAIFSILADKVINSKVLDLFAGSGALGIEALSRQAQHAIFIDNSTIACKTISKNLQKLNLSPKAEIIKQVASKYLQICKTKFDIIFIDQPYQEFDITLVNQTTNLLKSTGVVVVCCKRNTSFENLGRTLKVTLHKQYGDSEVYFLTSQTSRGGGTGRHASLRN